MVRNDTNKYGTVRLFAEQNIPAGQEAGQANVNAGTGMGGGGGTTPTAQTGSSQPAGMEQELIPLVVSGREMRYTMEELKRAASKAMGAERAFEEAAELRKSAQKAIQDAEDVRTKYGYVQEILTSEQPSEAAVAFMEETFGITAADLMGTEETKTGKPNMERTTEPARKITVQDLDPALGEVVRFADKKQLEESRQKLRTEIQEAVDRDAALCNIINKLPDNVKAAVKKEVNDSAFEDVQRKILGYEQYGPQMLENTIARMRSKLQNLGISEAALGQRPVTPLGPVSGFGAEITSDKPIERVSASDDTYLDNAARRLAQTIHQTLRR